MSRKGFIRCFGSPYLLTKLNFQVYKETAHSVFESNLLQLKIDYILSQDIMLENKLPLLLM